MMRSELRLNATQLKGTGESTELLQSRQKILQNELDANRSKIDLMNQKLQEAKRIFGENSTEVANLNRQIIDAQNVEAAIQNDLAETTAKLEEQTNANRQLQESIQLSDSRLKTFDQELALNEAKLSGASDKTQLLKERQSILANQSQESSNQIKLLENALETCGQEVGENSQEYVKLQGELTEAKTKYQQIQNEIQKTGEALKQQKSEVYKAGENLQTFGKSTEQAGRSLTVVSAASAGFLTASGAAAISFESAFAGVKKTTDEVFDANGKCVYSYQQLETGIRNMAKEMPTSAVEIAGVAESAGQLGIKTPDILDFTRVMIDMGNSTNLSSDVAATSMAKFANITGLAADETMSASEKYSRLGSVLVALGNNYATTEADIMAMAQNLAAAGSQVGMSDDQIMALAASLSSVGLEAQAGGTAFSKALTQMQLAVETNSDSLKDWADVAGMSVDEFSAKFKEDAAGALEAFIQGLSKCGGETDSAIKVLDEMGITETRMRDALLRSSEASDVFSSALKMGSEAWKENTALTEEANKRYETTESQLKIVKNNIIDAGISIGKVLLPEVIKVSKAVSQFAEKLSQLSPGKLKAIAGIAAFVAVLSPLLIFIGKISWGIGAILKVGSQLAGMFAAAGSAATGAGGAMAAGAGAAILPIIGIVAAVMAVIGVFTYLWKTSESFRDFFKNMWETLKETIRKFAEKIDFGDKIEAIKEKFGELKKNLGGLGNVFKIIGTVLGVVIVPVLGILAGLFNELLNCIAPIIDILSGLIAALGGLGDFIVGIFTGNLDLAKAGVKRFIGGIGQIFQGLWDLVKQGFSGFLDGIKAFFESLMEASGISGFIEGVKSKFSEIADKVSNVFATIGNIIQVGVMLIGEILSMAFQIITLPFQFIWQNCKDYVLAAWDVISTTVSNAITAIWNFISPGLQAIANVFSSIWNGIKDFLSGVWDGIKSTVSSAVNTVSNTISSAFSSIVGLVAGPLNAAQSTVSSIFDGIKSAIQSKINGAKDVVRNAINAIKGFFNFSWSLPHLKLPHFTVSGEFKLNPPSVPHFGISWYAKGAIFKRPTIFETAAGRKGVGEAGAEAVLPIALMRNYIEDSMNRVIEREKIIERRESIDYDRLAEAMSRQKIVGYFDEREMFRAYREGMA